MNGHSGDQETRHQWPFWVILTLATSYVSPQRGEHNEVPAPWQSHQERVFGVRVQVAVLESDVAIHANLQWGIEYTLYIKSNKHSVIISVKCMVSATGVA